MLASSEFLELIIFHQVHFLVYFVQEIGILCCWSCLHENSSLSTHSLDQASSNLNSTADWPSREIFEEPWSRVYNS